MAVKQIVGIGGAHMDWVASMGAPGPDGASTPGQVRTDVGGCCLNSVRVMRQLLDDVAVTMISARGGDQAGSMVEAAIDAADLGDQSGVYLDRATPTYTAILGSDGDVIAAVADMELYETALPRHLRRREVRETLEATDVLIVDANLPSQAIESAISATDGKVIALAISAAKAPRLAPSASRIDLVFMNRRELAALTDGDDVNRLAAVGFPSAVITDGANPVTVLENAEVHHVPVPPVADVLDVTGAGDALAGATIATMIRDPSCQLQDAVRIGIAASRKALTTQGPVPSLDWETFTGEANHYYAV